MKNNFQNQNNISNYNILDISPIKEGDSKSHLKRKKDDDSDTFSNRDKEQDKEDLLSFSSEDIETQMNRLLEIKKKEKEHKKTQHEAKKDINHVNKFLRNSIQKKTTKQFLRMPIINPEKNDNINKNNFIEEEKDKNVEKKRVVDKEKEEKNLRKIESKKKRLELLKRRQKEYLDLVDLQKKKRESEMKMIEEQINKQKEKYSKLYDGESVSNTESNIEDIDYSTKIENGLALLAFLFKNNLAFKKLNFLEKLLYNYPKKEEGQNNKGVRTGKKRKTQRLSVKRGSFREEKIKEKEKEDSNAEEIEEFSLNDEENPNDDTFVKLNRFKIMNKPVDKSQLVEYDLFYKEQFFKDEVFKYDVENIQDKEEKEINKEMNKLDCKRRLTEKKKLKEVNDLKGLDTTQLQEEIKKLTKEYEDIKKIVEPKVELELNNTEKLLQKGRILGFYFDQGQQKDYPHFSLRGEKEIGAEEIIDFKVLRKEEEARRYFDYSCCLEERKKINKVLVYMRYWCRLFVDNPFFDYLSLFVIIANTVLILISDPTDANNYGNITDNYFLYFYTVECVLKIIAFRFWASEDAYIRDYWNILDFFVVIVGWILFIVEKALNGTKISGLAGLRAFRILRPLKTVKRFKGLKKLVTALLLSLGHLGETGIVLFFFFLIFAIGGRQMWQGLFYRRCMNVNYGYLYSTLKYNYMCSFDSDCTDLQSYGIKYICSKGYRNPDSGAFNFDNVLTGFITTFSMATLEGWSDIFTYVSKTFKDKIYINPIIVFAYFHFFIFLSSFYMLKLFLAVTNAEYEHIEVSRRELNEKKSFFKLIQSKYDVKMKEKLEKKERERQLKANNSKKSDEALRDLYYKVVDDAFQINKNKRNIPILYSTVKDMYIMTNNNPEEIYLQTKRIYEEETFLSKDIKRQQKEIDREHEKMRIQNAKEMAKAREAEKERQAKIFVEQKKRREKEDAEHRRQVLEQLERDKAERLGKKYVPPEQKQKVYSKEENIQYFIKTIKTVYNPFRSGDTLKNCFKTLKVLLSNVVKNPNEDKFKHIKLSNPNIHERIGKISIALKLLEELGFVNNDELMTVTNVDIDLFNKTIGYLEAELSQLE